MKPELFVRSSMRVTASDYPEVGVGKAGHLTFNAAALAAMGVEPGALMVLYWYGDLGQVGVRGCRGTDPPGARFKLSRTGKGGKFGAAPFFRAYGIDCERAKGRYPLGQDSANNLWLFTLPKEARS